MSCGGQEGSAQIEGSAGQAGTKPFTATVAIREGYDSNPLTQSYQSTQDIRSSTEAVLFELLETAEHPKFKEVQGLVK